MKKFFIKALTLLHIIFGFNLDAWVKDHVQPAIDLVQNLKKFIDSPAADIIACLIPGDIAQHLRQTISDNLAKAIDILAPTQDVVNTSDVEAKVLKLAEWIKGLSPTLQEGAFHGLAKTLTKLSAGITGDTIKNHSIDLLVQSQYSAQKSGINDDDVSNMVDSLTAAAPVQVAVPESATPAAAVIDEVQPLVRDVALEHARMAENAKKTVPAQ